MTAYLLNCWYVAAFEAEVVSGAAMARTILNQRIAFFRDGSGVPIALADQCPHRFAQLHMGQVQDDVLECPYHGLRFDRSGSCVHNPHGDGVIPPQAKVRSFPITERYGLVWIWPGDASKADPELLPDVAIIECDEPNAIASGYMHTKANYELVTDNLMDLSHADYIHRATLNTGGSLSRMLPRVKARENSVNAHWSYRTEQVQPFFRGSMKDPDGPAYQSFDITWFPPSNLLLHVTARDVELPEEADAIYSTGHFLTPETDKSCHYFFVGRRNWDLQDADLNAALRAGIMSAFADEDKPALEAVQASMGDTTDIWSLNPVILSCDPGPVHARRMLQKLISREREAPPATK